MASGNLIDVVEDLRMVVADLKRLLYGDEAARSSGLLKEFDGLRGDVQLLHTRVERLNDEVSQIKAKKPNRWMWILGYLAFAGSVTCGVLGFVNLVPGTNVLDMPPALALWLAAVLLLAALLLFMGGFGWLDRGS